MLASSIPTKIQLPFASSGTKNTIPVPSQIGITPGAASYTDGFPPLTFTALTAGGIPPDGADVNGVLNAITAIQQWQSAGGHFKYDSAFSTAIGGYPAGAILNSSDGLSQWLNLADNNTTDPDGATPANWAALSAYGITTVSGLTNANVTLTATQYKNRIIVLTGTLTGNIQIIFPTLLQQWKVINNTTGNFTVTCKTAAGTGAAVSAIQDFYGDGTNLIPVGFEDFVPVAQDFRLTLTSGTPVTTADVTAATTIYCTPYKGQRIGLWNGRAFQNYQSAEFSIALGTLVSGKAYDIFAYLNAGVPALEIGPAWTNDTTRATALAYQNGILVKSGDATRRYLGTFYTTATTTTEDSQANRYLWNYYNRVVRMMRRIETTASWTYTTATWRQANGSTANQLNFIVGVAEDIVEARVDVENANTTLASAECGTALDSTTTPTRHQASVMATASAIYGNSCADEYLPSSGRHYLAWLEYSQAAGTTTWYGSGYGAGIVGRMMA